MVYYAPIYTWCVVCIEIYGRSSNTKVHVYAKYGYYG